MEKEYLVRIMECINEHFQDFAEFRSAMKKLALDLYRKSFLSIDDIYIYGVMLYASLHLPGVEMRIEDEETQDIASVQDEK